MGKDLPTSSKVTDYSIATRNFQITKIKIVMEIQKKKGFVKYFELKELVLKLLL